MTLRQKSPRRSLLFIPGDSWRKIEKGTQLGTDMVILDLEDAVAFDQKQEARQVVVSALSSLDFGKTECLVRVNGLDTGHFAADLEAVAGTGLEGIVVPKLETAPQIRLLDQHLSTAEAEHGRAAGSIRLFILIETALAVMNLGEIAQASPRLDALLFGAEDLVVELGTIRSPAAWEVFYARSAVVTAAAAFGLQAIDMVFVGLHDLVGLKEEAEFARQLGYTGKMAIHPRQVELLNRVFSPSAADIDHARRLVTAYQEQAAAGSGAFVVDGRMVDRPVVLAAERVLERARLCQLFDE